MQSFTTNARPLEPLRASHRRLPDRDNYRRHRSCHVRGMGVNWYNEIDPYAAQWLRNLIQKQLIPPGTVDERPIQDVKPADLVPFTQCHFFAGIGGWPLALCLANFPADRTVWTGSCPCQPFSAAGKSLGFADERHLWPFWFHLISVCRPAIVFGEQVATAAAWLALVRSDLEALEYAVGAMPIEAACVGAPHKRDRFWFVADAAKHGCERLQRGAKAQIPEDGAPETLGPWDDSSHPFSNWREQLAQSTVVRVDDGVSSALDIRPRLRAYGNAIVPQVAAEFIKAYMECRP